MSFEKGIDGGIDGETSRRRFIAAAGATSAGLFAGCLGGSGGDGGGGGGGTTGMDDGTTGMDDGTTGMDGATTGESMGSTDGGDSPGSSWRTFELTTVRGGEPFTVAGLEAPVVLQSFAVWCPKCQRQSEALAGVTDSVTVVSLNTDPNEDAAKVRQHAEDNGFDWRFAVAPTGMTNSLVEEFGPAVTNPPSTPIIVDCGDGTAEFRSGGISSAGEIRTLAGEC